MVCTSFCTLTFVPKEPQSRCKWDVFLRVRNRILAHPPPLSRRHGLLRDLVLLRPFLCPVGPWVVEMCVAVTQTQAGVVCLFLEIPGVPLVWSSPGGKSGGGIAQLAKVRPVVGAVTSGFPWPAAWWRLIHWAKWCMKAASCCSLAFETTHQEVAVPVLCPCLACQAKTPRHPLRYLPRAPLDWLWSGECS
jgi:hypothetical protein